MYHLVHTNSFQERVMYFETSVDIKASADIVWATLIDIAHWPETTPSITRATLLTDAPLALGSRAQIKQPGIPELVWEVTEFQPGSGFTWRTSSPGVTTVGGHALRIDANRVVLTLSLRQTGVLSVIVGWLTGARTRRYVQMEAEGLKRRCEAASVGAEHAAPV
jgi:uncharacterized membrane protein